MWKSFTKAMLSSVVVALHFFVGPEESGRTAAEAAAWLWLALSGWGVEGITLVG